MLVMITTIMMLMLMGYYAIRWIYESKLDLFQSANITGFSRYSQATNKTGTCTKTEV